MLPNKSISKVKIACSTTQLQDKFKTKKMRTSRCTEKYFQIKKKERYKTAIKL